MTRLLPVLASLVLASCSGVHPYDLNPRAIEAGPEVAPILETLLKQGMPVKQPLLVPIQYEGQELYQLVKPWEHDGHELPVGLVVDGASVPRAVWTFMPPDGLHRAGALFHDWLYINRGVLPDGFRYDRQWADTTFYNMMVEAGVGEKRAGIAYRAVRAFGWHAWNSVEEPLILPVDFYSAPRRTVKTARSRHLYAEPQP